MSRPAAAALAALAVFPLIVIVIVIGGTGGAGGAQAAAPAAAAAPVPAGVAVAAGGGGAAWARALLAAGGWPQTRCNTGAVVAWERAEGSNPAWHNLLDTTLREPGSRPVNSVGVQAYLTVQQGLAATIATLRGPPYGPIRAALAASTDAQGASEAQAVADAVAASPWGTEPFTASCT